MINSGILVTCFMEHHVLTYSLHFNDNKHFNQVINNLVYMFYKTVDYHSRVKVTLAWRETTPVCSGLTRLVCAGYSRHDSGASRKRAGITRRAQFGSCPHTASLTCPCSYLARSTLNVWLKLVTFGEYRPFVLCTDLKGINCQHKNKRDLLNYRYFIPA